MGISELCIRRPVLTTLITVSFLLVWWGLFGTDLIAGIVGGVTLALVWATYSQLGADRVPRHPPPDPQPCSA